MCQLKIITSDVTQNEPLDPHISSFAKHGSRFELQVIIRTIYLRTTFPSHRAMTSSKILGTRKGPNFSSYGLEKVLPLGPRYQKRSYIQVLGPRTGPIFRFQVLEKGLHLSPRFQKRSYIQVVCTRKGMYQVLKYKRK